MPNSDNPFGEPISNNVYVPQQGGYSTPDQAPSSSNNWWDKASNYGQVALDYATQIFSGAGKRKREKEAREYQINMYNMQKADQRAMIDEQNFYNSPAEQMKRLKDAGLSSHLMYGKGVTSQQPTAGAPPAMTSQQALSSPLSFLTEQKSLLELEFLKEQVREKRIQNNITAETSDDTIASASLNRKTLDKNLQLIDQAVTTGAYDVALKSLKYEVESDPDIGMKKVAAIQYALLQFDEKFKNNTYNINVEQLQTLLNTAKVDEKLKNELLSVAQIHTGMWEEGISPNDSAFERSLSGALLDLFDENSEVGRAVYGTLEKLPFGKQLIPLLKAFSKKRSPRTTNKSSYTIKDGKRIETHSSTTTN